MHLRPSVMASLFLFGCSFTPSFSQSKVLYGHYRPEHSTHQVYELDEWLSDPKRRITFDSNAWKAQHHRELMVGDLINSYPLIGMEKQKVYELLGPGTVPVVGAPPGSNSKGPGATWDSVVNKETYPLDARHDRIVPICAPAVVYLDVQYNDKDQLQSLQLLRTPRGALSHVITKNAASATVKPE